MIHIPSRLDNCKICGKLFLREHTDNCLDCYKEVEHEFKCVVEFLMIEQNRNATIEEVSNSTNVSLKQIADFMRDGRIYGDDYPNLGFPCSHCGKLIKRQVLCDDCFDQFSSEVNTTLKRDKLADEIGRKERISSNDAQYWRLKRN